jgi:hypothetical protein
MKVKYIKTEDNEIIVFSELQEHSDFKSFKPIGAGFISIGAPEKYEPDCTCYGESVSLNLKSDGKVDTKLARKQILGYDY